MIEIPSGILVQGRLRGEPMDQAPYSEPLELRVDVPAYFIDEFEFPNDPTQPAITEVTSVDAERMCGEHGKRLCTTVQWERACKGPEVSVYSYGQVYDPICGDWSTGTPGMPVGDVPAHCRSGFGVAGLSSGVVEWALPSSQQDEARYATAERALVKGGARLSPVQYMRCASVGDEVTLYSSSIIGFRCCWSR